MMRRRQLSRAQCLRRHNNLPQGTRRNAFAERDLRRIKVGTWQNRIDSTRFGSIHKGAVGATDDSIAVRTRLPEKVGKDCLRIASTAKMSAGNCACYFNWSVAPE